MTLFNEESIDENLQQTMQKWQDRIHPFRVTPYIVTLSEHTITDIDVQNLLEAGLRVVRFKMTTILRDDKINILQMLKSAIAHCCEKYEVTSWPIAVIVDLPNSSVRTGYLKDDILKGDMKIFIPLNSSVVITSEPKYWNQCDSKIIFINDEYTLETIKPKTEINLKFGEICLVCTEVINNKNIRCVVTVAGNLESALFVCFRGVKLRRPIMSRQDKELISLAKEQDVDVVTLTSVRIADTVDVVRRLFSSNPKPLIMVSICEQEGLDNIDSIIARADGVILAREFLSVTLMKPQQITLIQLQVSAKCRRAGKPFFISGNVMENSLDNGTILYSEVNDVANALLQGAGVLLRLYTNVAYLVQAMKLLNWIHRSFETIPLTEHFWWNCFELPVPVNAANAAAVACAITARQTKCNVAIVLTVTGSTARQLSRVAPGIAIISVSKNLKISRQLQMYTGVLPLLYDETCINDNWYQDMSRRIHFAVMYCVRHEILNRGQRYIVLRKAKPESAFCDQISTWEVTLQESLAKTERLHRSLT